ncbi:LOW QUALITY PROTEIN: uncharacterized protein [Blastocystis hominis]|uniref:ATPase AAA-type core domain-containing protein n=1 Tax=Blastocystis hominis TaxID=12968 RepID=D8LV33_BLAHO|nr:LOW QUALITY PROTEIN: uncharacterized protein [Blastocystis hominis]CBK19672.2 unnamed protein product [Blastocystis hominis]|eukprot:XP_012893720.1 LOW QUALITY PROTEIN: uncharacterized protein [Blastocystis hominis]
MHFFLNLESMVFLKRNKNWMSKSVIPDSMQSLAGHRDSSSTHHIEQLIDQVREARARREQLKKEISSKGKERKRLIDWGDHFQPRSFIDLLSDGLANRVFMKWLTQWKPLLFHTSPNPSTAEVDSLPFVAFSPLIPYSSAPSVTKEDSTPLPVAPSPLFVPSIAQIFPRRSLSAHSIRSMTHRQAFDASATCCGKSTLVHIAANAQKLRVVALMGETNGTPLQRTLEQIETVMQVRGVSFGKEKPPLLLLDNFDSSFSQSERKAIVKLLLKLYNEALHDPSKQLVPVVITCVDAVAF